MVALAKSSLSSDRKRLIELMQRVNFGRIENLFVRDGEPVLDPPPRVVYEIKFSGENGPRPEAGIDDFAVKAQIVDLLAHFDRLRNATIELLTVKHGLPFGMHVEANA